MIDGSQSKQVVQYFINNQDKAMVIRGNHCWFVEDYYRTKAQVGLWGGTTENHPWLWNGGETTLDSYPGREVSKEHRDFLKSRPLWYENDDILITHAPIYNLKELPPTLYCQDDKILERFLWERDVPNKPFTKKFYVFGHNSKLRLYEYINEETHNPEPYAICIDDSARKQLTGLHWDGNFKYSNIYQVDYVR